MIDLQNYIKIISKYFDRSMVEIDPSDLIDICKRAIDAESERDELKAKTVSNDEIVALRLALHKQNNKVAELKAKLAEMEKQEPVGEITSTHNGNGDGQFFNVNWLTADFSVGDKLYSSQVTANKAEVNPIPYGAELFDIIFHTGYLTRSTCSEIVGLISSFLSNKNKEIQEGWKLVPIEPTDLMLDAAWEIEIECHNHGKVPDFSFLGEIKAKECWKIMLEHSPLPPLKEHREPVVDNCSCADAAFESYVSRMYKGADSDEWHDAPVNEVFKDGFKAGLKVTANKTEVPDWENEAKRAFWTGLEIGAGMGNVSILPRWNEYIAKRKGELSLPPLKDGE